MVRMYIVIIMDVLFHGVRLEYCRKKKEERDIKRMDAVRACLRKDR